MNRQVRSLATAALVVVPVALLVLPAVSGDVRGTRDTMDTILHNIRVLLELSVSEDDFAREENQVRVTRALRELEDQAAILASHGFPDNVGADFLASALQRYVTLMSRTYEWGATDQTVELLYQTTDICIACHTRLRSTSRAPSAEAFIDAATLDAIPSERRANIQVATRRFDAARATIETRLAQSLLDPEPLRRALTTYLVVNVRVLADYERPVEPLEALSRRADLDPALRKSLGRWVEDLRALQTRAPLEADLQTGRSLAEIADTREQAGAHDGLVYHIAASGVLQEMIVGHDWSDSVLAEAYYRLGVAEYHIGWKDWIPQAELYLESAILVAPGGKWARPAFDLLDRKVRSSVAERGDGSLPPEVELHLDTLERSIETQ